MLIKGSFLVVKKSGRISMVIQTGQTFDIAVTNLAVESVRVVNKGIVTKDKVDLLCKSMTIVLGFMQCLRSQPRRRV